MLFCTLPLEPSHVRQQRGSFEQAFVEHEKRYLKLDKDKVFRWRGALTEAANLSGWDISDR